MDFLSNTLTAIGSVIINKITRQDVARCAVPFVALALGSALASNHIFKEPTMLATEHISQPTLAQEQESDYPMIIPGHSHQTTQPSQPNDHEARSGSAFIRSPHHSSTSTTTPTTTTATITPTTPTTPRSLLPHESHPPASHLYASDPCPLIPNGSDARLSVPRADARPSVPCGSNVRPSVTRGFDAHPSNPRATSRHSESHHSESYVSHPLPSDPRRSGSHRSETQRSHPRVSDSHRSESRRSVPRRVDPHGVNPRHSDPRRSNRGMAPHHPQRIPQPSHPHDQSEYEILLRTFNISKRLLHRIPLELYSSLIETLINPARCSCAITMEELVVKNRRGSRVPYRVLPDTVVLFQQLNSEAHNPKYQAYLFNKVALKTWFRQSAGTPQNPITRKNVDIQTQLFEIHSYLYEKNHQRN